MILTTASPAQEETRGREAPRAPSPVRICPRCASVFVRISRGGGANVRCVACLPIVRDRERYIRRAIKYKREQGAFMGELRRTA